MKILLDENISPTLVSKLGALGIAAQHIVHLGQSGLSDPDLWRLAFVRDEVVVTINAADFLKLAGEAELHPGLIVIRSRGLSREEQWAWLEPVVQHFLESEADLTNKVIEVIGPGRFSIRDLPRS